jgi:hypothetical protein
MTAMTAAELRAKVEAWQGCVRRLIAVAPTRTVMDETGVSGGHSTPPEREAIRGAALAVVDNWLARDLALLPESGVFVTVDDLSRAMHPTWFEELPKDGPATMTPHEWGRLVGDVHRRRWKAMREATAIIEQLSR